jgi:hypothetical protein
MAEGSSYFRVDGADLESGLERVLVIEASGLAEAEEKARRKGLLIAAVRPAVREDHRAVGVTIIRSSNADGAGTSDVVTGTRASPTGGTSVFLGSEPLVGTRPAGSARPPTIPRPAVSRAKSGASRQQGKAAAKKVPGLPSAASDAPRATMPTPVAAPVAERETPPAPEAPSPARSVPNIESEPEVLEPQPSLSGDVLRVERNIDGAPVVPTVAPAVIPTLDMAEVVEPNAPLSPSLTLREAEPELEMAEPLVARLDPQDSMAAMERIAGLVAASTAEAITEAAVPSGRGPGAARTLPTPILEPAPPPVAQESSPAATPATAPYVQASAPPRAPQGPGWTVVVLLCPLAFLSLAGGVGVLVWSLCRVEAADLSELQRLDAHLQTLTQSFLGGMLVVAGLILFVAAGLVYVGGALRARR